jgi:histone H1/5
MYSSYNANQCQQDSCHQHNSNCQILLGKSNKKISEVKTKFMTIKKLEKIFSIFSQIRKEQKMAKKKVAKKKAAPKKKVAKKKAAPKKKVAPKKAAPKKTTKKK